MMIHSIGVLPGHAGPVLIRPQVGLLTTRHGNLIPELGAQPGESLGLGHGQGNLYPLYQHLNMKQVLQCVTTETLFLPGYPLGG